MNLIFEYLNKEQRSLKWLCDRLKMPYYRFYNMKDLSNTDLLSKLTIKEAEKLKELIPNIETRLKNE